MAHLLDRVVENHRQFMAMGHVRFAFGVMMAIVVGLGLLALILWAFGI